MPDLPIVDTHVHMWDPNVLDYAWHANFPEFQKPHVFAAFDAARGPVEVEQIVFLECLSNYERSLDELAWVSSLWDQDERLAAIIPSADLARGEGIRSVLASIAENPYVPGIRRLIQEEPDIDFCIGDDFVKGVSMLAEFDLHFEICIYHPQLANAIRLAQRCPEVRFILDHIGKPGIKEGLFEPWGHQMKELAGLPNVWCKISGVTTEADHDRWTREDLKPYIEHVIDCFGFDRIMFGGDWPVATWASDYPQWVETLDWVVEGATAEEKRKLYCDNAVGFYRLDRNRG